MAHSNSISSATARQEHMLDLLDDFLHDKLPYDPGRITKLAENYFLVDEIVQLSQFAKWKYTAVELIEGIHLDGSLRFSVRGNKIRLKPKELNSNPDTILSKKLSWILRHAGEKEGLHYDRGGFLNLDDVLANPQFQGFSEQDVIRVVNVNNKQRFQIEDDAITKRKKIRALQGHSMKIEGLNLRLILDPAEYPVVIHGTYTKPYEKIKTEGLSRMGRTHIHFAPGEPGATGVISGLRSSAQIYIYIDMAAAMKDNIKFYSSGNNVILTEGDRNGMLPSRYFKKVVDKSKANHLESSSSDRDALLLNKLSSVLQRRVEQTGLQVQSEGFLLLTDLLKSAEFGGFSEIDLVRVIESNKNNKFDLRKQRITGHYMVRAFQGAVKHRRR